MNRSVRVHLLPALFEPEELRGGMAVVLDVLRASTTIVHALAHGASCVVPTLTVEKTQQLATEYPPGACLLGGEREGVLIPGFDLDNNPLAYTTEAVRNKTILFTTTNGTAALHRAALADRVVVGSFVNLQAVVRSLTRDARPVHVVCAGTRGKISAEDVLCAGAVVDRLAAACATSAAAWDDDSLQLAWRLYGSVAQRPAFSSTAADTGPVPLVPDASALLDVMRNSYGGRNCRRLGFDEQIVRAATLDLFDLVPEYDARTGRLTCASADGAGT
jgi:2-phosphosulfolactate phosphatase